MSYVYKYPRPMVTVDAVVFGIDRDELQILLIKRGSEPYREHWALPGGFVPDDETVEMAVERELIEETGLSDLSFHPLRAYSDPERDPRGRNITFAFVALHFRRPDDARAGDDASEAVWYDIEKIPLTAFDHDEIISDAVYRLRELVLTSDILFAQLPTLFSAEVVTSALEIIFAGTVDQERLLNHFMDIGLITPAEPRIVNGETIQMFCTGGD